MDFLCPSFKYGEIIPKKFTADGEDVSPPLKWSCNEKKVKSYAIICDDPDAPAGTWVHWVYYNIPSEYNELPENITTSEKPVIGGLQGVNDFHKIGYEGPSPPGGQIHRYFFKIYALNSTHEFKPGLSKKELMQIIQADIIDKASFMGKYKRAI
jgi:Raf kinase inhibitor-like YbhB/YbcL family protein